MRKRQSNDSGQGSLWRGALGLLATSLTLSVIGGCANNQTENALNGRAIDLQVPALGNIEYHTFMLANELFEGARPSRQARYAVVGFVPSDTMKYDADSQHPLMSLSQQLEQGLITEATKRGFTAQEFKVADSILINATSDRVLTRDLEQLDSVERVDFYITGTMTMQQSGAVVNARVINVQSKEVVSAATKFFPADLFWQTEAVTTRNGLLYRTQG